MPALREVVSAAEPLPVELAVAVKAALPPATRLFNSYSATETVGDPTTLVEVRTDGWAATPAPPGASAAATCVGWGVPGVSVHIRDTGTGERVAPGQPGEVCLEAPTFVALQYFGHPDVTAARLAGGCYNTGDHGVVSPDDGALWLMGRLGVSVKIRGHTVDLSEVESVLQHLPGMPVTHAAVVSRDTGVSGLQRLVAFVQPGTGAGVSGAEYTAAVAARLPAYMVPAVVVEVALPLLHTGKVNRRALTARAAAAELASVPRRADSEKCASDAVRLKVIDVWVDVLFAEADGPAARATLQAADGAAVDFFGTLGGDSVSSVLMLAQLRKALGVNVGLSQLAAHSTLSAFAAAVQKASVSLSVSARAADGSTSDGRATVGAQSGAGAGAAAASAGAAELSRTPTYDVIPMTAAHFDDVLTFLSAEFASRESLCVAMGVTQEELHAFFVMVAEPAPELGLSAVAIERGTGRLIAASLNIDAHVPDGAAEEEPELSPAMGTVAGVLMGLEGEYFGKCFGGKSPPPGTVVNGLATGVVPDVANAAEVARAVDVAAFTAAAAKGYTRVYGIFTHSVTQYVALNELGYESHAVVRYDDVKAADGSCPFAGSMPPGVDCAVLADSGLPLRCL